MSKGQALSQPIVSKNTKRLKLFNDGKKGFEILYTHAEEEGPKSGFSLKG